MEHAVPPHRLGVTPSVGATGFSLPGASTTSAPLDLDSLPVADTASELVSMAAGIEVPAQNRDVNEGRLLTPAEVAGLFGVDPRTVSRWSDRGVLKAVYTAGGHRRYRYLDVMTLRDSLSHRD